jgi:hypothetical protein
MKQEDKEGFICVYRTPYQSEIVVIKSLLIDSQIPYFIENETFASLGSADGAVNFGIMIQKEFTEEAKELLKDFTFKRQKPEEN